MKFIILGCGSSMGVPKADGDFGDCNPKEKKNFRSRCSALISSKNQNILIDTSPDLRTQLLSNNIKKIDKVLYSHMHADQMHGINDLRVFFLKKKNTIPVYADKITSKYLLKTFSYCFKRTQNSYPAILNLNKVKRKMYFTKNKEKILIESLNVKHGLVNCVCYKINKKVIYISDVSKIDKKDFNFFKNIKFLVIDCFSYNSHPSHLNLQESLNLIKEFKPKKAILTNLHSTIDYSFLKKKLPKEIIPAFDGLTFSF